MAFSQDPARVAREVYYYNCLIYDSTSSDVTARKRNFTTEQLQDSGGGILLAHTSNKNQCYVQCNSYK